MQYTVGKVKSHSTITQSRGVKNICYLQQQIRSQNNTVSQVSWSRNLQNSLVETFSLLLLFSSVVTHCRCAARCFYPSPCDLAYIALFK